MAAVGWGAGFDHHAPVSGSVRRGGGSHFGELSDAAWDCIIDLP